MHAARYGKHVTFTLHKWVVNSEYWILDGDCNNLITLSEPSTGPAYTAADISVFLNNNTIIINTNIKKIFPCVSSMINTNNVPSKIAPHLTYLLLYVNRIDRSWCVPINNISYTGAMSVNALTRLSSCQGNFQNCFNYFLETNLLLVILLVL